METRLVSWCSQNNLVLNTLKTVEMVVEFRKDKVPRSPITLLNSLVDIVESFRFLGSIITQDLKWDVSINSIISNGQQRMYFLYFQLKKFCMPVTITVQFNTAITGSILTSFTTAEDKRKWQLSSTQLRR